MESDDSVVAKWERLKVTVETLELDLQKNARGVAAAGVRVRKGLRELKAQAADLVKTTVEIDKANKAAKKAARAKA